MLTNYSKQSILLIVVVLAWCTDAQRDTDEIRLQMPRVRTAKDDDYLCHAVDVSDSTKYITAFTPITEPDTAHHIILFGCNTPGSTKKFWHCGEMESKDDLPQEPVCSTSPTIIYAWAMDAPPLKLDEDVSFKVGQGTSVNYIIMQIHYKDAAAFTNYPNRTDKSGVILQITKTPTSKLAGVYTNIAGGAIAPKSITYSEMACPFTGKAMLHPFAFRTHAHKHGVVVSGFVVRNGRWLLIGQESPQKPQMFYPVKDTDLVVTNGDILASRCIMQNNESITIQMGSTRQDEMCNFYMMYWVDSSDAYQFSDILNQNCISMGWPSFHWNKVVDTSGVPLLAKTEPESGKVYEETAKLTINDEDENRRNYLKNNNVLYDDEIESFDYK